MGHRPTIGAVGRTHSVLSPIGQAIFDGVVFQVRAEEANIDLDRHVMVTGFDPWSLTVREATPEEVAAKATPIEPAESNLVPILAMWVVRVACVGFLGSFVVVGAFWSFEVGGLVGIGYVLSTLGQIWLLVLIVRECERNAIVLAFIIPCFTWYFAWERWDVAKRPFLLNILGIIVSIIGILISN
jgi:hypothetical protein